MSTGYCYVAETPDALKFGYSQAPWARNPRSEKFGYAKIVAYTAGSRIQEARLHELLRPWRIEGEWYQRAPVTESAAALFPKREGRTIVNDIVDEAYRENRDAARALILQCMQPGRIIGRELRRISHEAGFRPRRVRAMWHLEARSISDVELQILGRLAQRARDFAAGEEA